MKKWQKSPGHRLNPRKPGRGGTLKQRTALVKGARGLVVQVKIDGHSILSFLDERGQRLFMWPKSRLPLPLDAELLAKLRAECAGLDGTLVFELCCRSSGHQHAFHGLSGLSRRKNKLSIADWHLWNMTLVVLTGDEGADADARIALVERHFAAGMVHMRADGHWLWPFDPARGHANPIVSVVGAWRLPALTVEADLLHIRSVLSKPNSPAVEGLVCHLLYEQTQARPDPRNGLELWGLLSDPGYRYESTNTFKVKEEGRLHVVVTGLFRGTALEDEEKPVLAILRHLDPATGQDKLRVESIPLSARMAARLEIALEAQHEVEAWAWRIDWYFNHRLGEDGRPSLRGADGVSPVRFVCVTDDMFKTATLVNARAPGGPPFAFETAKTRSQQPKSAAQLRGETARKEAKTRRAQEKLEDGGGYNHRTGLHFTAREMKNNAATHKVVMSALQECVLEIDPPARSALERSQDELRMAYAQERSPTPLEIHTRHANRHENDLWYKACDLDGDLAAGAAPVRSRLKPREPTELEKSDVRMDRDRMFRRIKQMRAADEARYGATRAATRLEVIAEAALLGIRVGPPCSGDHVLYIRQRAGDRPTASHVRALHLERLDSGGKVARLRAALHTAVLCAVQPPQRVRPEVLGLLHPRFEGQDVAQRRGRHLEFIGMLREAFGKLCLVLAGQRLQLRVQLPDVVVRDVGLLRGAARHLPLRPLPVRHGGVVRSHRPCSARCVCHALALPAPLASRAARASRACVHIHLHPLHGCKEHGSVGRVVDQGRREACRERRLARHRVRTGELLGSHKQDSRFRLLGQGLRPRPLQIEQRGHEQMLGSVLLRKECKQ